MKDGAGNAISTTMTGGDLGTVTVDGDAPDFLAVTATDGDGASTQFVRIIEIIIHAEEKDMRDVLSDYVIISFVVLYSVYSMWRRRKAPNSKD